jgi:hypothetical protein
VAANHEPKPHDLPVGLVGSPQATGALAAQLERSAPGSFEFHGYSSPAAAQTGVLQRSVYGAFESASQPTLLIATAASPAAARVFRQSFGMATHAQGHTLVVRDLAPLPPSDSSGATSSSAVLSLIIAGVLGSAVIYLIAQHRTLAVRLAALAALAIGAGLLTALATNVVVGAFSDHVLAVWGVATLFVLAIALPIAAFQVLFGLAGTGVGLIVFVVIGDPSSGGGTAPELLPGFWRAISQHLPPGAGSPAMRKVVYFNGYGATRALIVLGVYASLGAIGAVVAYRLRAGAEPIGASS